MTAYMPAAPSSYLPVAGIHDSSAFWTNMSGLRGHEFGSAKMDFTHAAVAQEERRINFCKLKACSRELNIQVFHLFILGSLNSSPVLTNTTISIQSLWRIGCVPADINGYRHVWALCCDEVRNRTAYYSYLQAGVCAMGTHKSLLVVKPDLDLPVCKRRLTKGA